MRLFEGVQLAFGPTTGDRLLLRLPPRRSRSREEDFPAIEAEMQKIVKADERFERLDMPRDEALELCRELGQEFKVEHIETGLADEKHAVVLPPGRVHRPVPRQAHPQHRPHRQGVQAALASPAPIGRATPSREQLQRLYATAFFDKKELDAHLEQLEEAKRRDHRVLGKQLELFTISQTVGSGLILWLPKGAIIRQTLEDYIKGELRKPRLRSRLHAEHRPRRAVRDLRPLPVLQRQPVPADRIRPSDGERYLLKPMNCPHHIMIYKAKPRSYRDLPVRLAEFGTVYRFEQSGELSGMTRVRGFTQDDAHIFCTEEQVADEFRGCLEMTQSVLASLGMNDYRVRLGFRDPKSDKYVGGAEVWDRAEAALKAVCESMNLPDMSIEPGEAAFYGPKVDFVVTDCIGREWQLGTVQLDYNLPSKERFGLEYIGADNQPHQPVMIHRAPLGSLERFVGVLIEHFAGAFPLWLAPEQVRVLTVSEKSEAYGREVEAKLAAAGFRVDRRLPRRRSSAPRSARPRSS